MNSKELKVKEVTLFTVEFLED